MKKDFFIEIEVEKDGKIVTLDTDDMDINIYQKLGGEKVRIFEIMCFQGGVLKDKVSSVTVAEFVGKKNYDGINVEVTQDKVMSIYSE